MTDAPETGQTQQLSTDPDATTEPDTTTAETTESETDWEAEAKKWQEQSRKQEARAKANAAAAKELESFKLASMSEQEQAVAQARTEGEQAALLKVGSRLVDAEVRVAAAGRNADIDALLEGLDRTKFLTDEGEPDVDAIKAWVERIAPAQAETETGPLAGQIDLGQGSRSAAPDGQAAFVRQLQQLVGPPK